MAIIDFHTHILPGIDDGSKSVEMSMEMLRMSEEQGVDIMLATPHFYASRHRVEDFLERRERAFGRLMKRKGDTGPQLKLGAEVAFFSGISRADRMDALTVEDTDILLLEMPFTPWSKAVVEEVDTLIAKRGFQIVLAHLERYMEMPENRRWIGDLLAMPVYVQINAESLLHWGRRRKLIGMFRKGEAHFLGSDCHRTDRREPNLGKGREVLKKKLGEDFLKRMDESGGRLLQSGGKRDV